MSEQPSPTSPVDTSKKAEFGGVHLLIGFALGAALQFGWWALLDRLALRTVDSSNDGFLAQLLAAIGQSRTTGFLLGAVWGATSNPAHVPIRSIVSKALRWAFGFALAFLGLDVMRWLLQTALGESLGSIVTSVIWFGLAGAFVGLIMELQRTVAPHIGSAPLSFRQIARWALTLKRAAVLRVLVVALLVALIGVTIEMLFQRLSVWPLMMLPIAAVAIIAVRMWRPSRKTLRQWAIGILALIIIIILLLLLDLSTTLGVLAGIVVLVVMVLIQSRKDIKG